MPGVGVGLREVLDGALFDKRFYELAHPDVKRAIAAGSLESALQHYQLYGKTERRSRALNMLPWLATPRFAALFRSGGDYLSGAKLKFSGDAGGVYRFIGFQRRGLKLSKAWDERVDYDSMFEGGLGHVMWPPIAGSSGRRFAAVLMKVGLDGRASRPTEFLIETAEGLVYSSPRADAKSPSLITMSPVTQCNLNCIHCVSRFTRARVRELSDDIWGEFQRLARENRIYRMAADYSGDILYAQGRPSRWLERLIALGVDLEINTHANNLSFELSDLLIKSRLADINFSLDSMDPVDYPKIRKGARPLDEVLKNIARFMRMRNARKPWITTSISFVLMRRNLSSLPAAIDFAARHKVSRVNAVHLRVFTSDMVEQSAILDLKAYAEAYRLAMDFAASRNVELVMPPPVTSRRHRKGHTPCAYPWNGATIVGNGDVQACCMPGSVVGNLNEEKLEDIWDGKRMRDFRSRVNTPDPPSPCGECWFYGHANNFEAYVPGLPKADRERFVARVLAQDLSTGI